MGKVLKYTDYEKQWIKENRYNYKTIKEFLSAFNDKFNKNMPISYMKELVITLGTRVGRKKYFEEPHGIWLRKNRIVYENLEKLRIAFNKEFNVDVSYYSMKKIVQNFNAFPENKKTNNDYTSEELEWFRQNYKRFMLEFRFDYEGLRVEFENNFNKKLSKHYHDNLFRNKLKIDVFYDRSMTTHAKNIDLYPVGYEKKDRDTWLVKIEKTKFEKGKRVATRQGYRPKANILYEQYHNIKVNDKTHCIVHLDRNNDNFEKDNLVLVEKKVRKHFIAKSITYDSPKLTKTLLAISQLECILKERKN